jgi:hypothetical protein
MLYENHSISCRPPVHMLYTVYIQSNQNVNFLSCPSVQCDITFLKVIGTRTNLIFDCVLEVTVRNAMWFGIPTLYPSKRRHIRENRDLLTHRQGTTETHVGFVEAITCV